MLSDDQRHILEEEKKELKQQRQLQSKKIAALNQAFIIEHNQSLKFQYQEQIQREEINLANIKSRLNEVEKQLQSANPQNKLLQLLRSLLPWLLLVGALVGGIRWLLIYITKPSIVELCSQPSTNCVDKTQSATKANNDVIANNNQKILDEFGKGGQVYAIAVVVPQGNTKTFISKNILNGVANKQFEFNNRLKSPKDPKNNWKLLVLMANEMDKSGQQDRGMYTAEELIKQKQILGVVGPFSSSSLSYVVNKYCQDKDNVALISPTANIPIQDLNSIVRRNLLRKLKNECFFRVTGTSIEAINSLIKYSPNHYKRVLVIKDDGDAFTNSFFEDFTNQIKGKILYDIGDEFSLKKTEEEIKKKIEDWGKKYKAEETAILIMPNPKHKDESNENTENVEKVIRANDGKFLLLGDNTVYTPQLPDKINSTAPKSIKRGIVVAVPFYKPGKNQQEDLIWHYAMSYDAIQVLIDAISKAHVELNKSDITREDVLNQIHGLRVQLPNTLTGIIEFKDKKNKDSDPNDLNDRKDAPYDLIQPNCSTSPCKWEKINLDDKTKQKSAP
jgi:ABC-type branched-subunit amino acid transport system substrate-binding protein